MHPVYRFFVTPASFAPTLLRLLLAAVFLVHGGQKAFGWMGGEGWTATLQSWTAAGGLHLPYTLAALGVLVEILGALGLLLGLCTRLAALGIFCNMAVAVGYVHWKSGFLAKNGGYEYPLSLGVVALALMLAGGGRFSLDRAIADQLMP